MANTNPYQTPDPTFQPADTYPPIARPSEPSGIGGWLILIAIGLIFSPIRLTAAMFTIYLPIFANGAWDVLTTPGTEQYHALWGPLIIFEIVTNGAFIVLYSVLIFLFFRKSKFFPRTYIAISIANLLFIVADAWLGSLVLPAEATFDTDTLKEVVRAVISVCIWVPYMLLSRRVKNTFIN